MLYPFFDRVVYRNEELSSLPYGGSNPFLSSRGPSYHPTMAPSQVLIPAESNIVLKYDIRFGQKINIYVT